MKKTYKYNPTLIEKHLKRNKITLKEFTRKTGFSKEKTKKIVYGEIMPKVSDYVKICWALEVGYLRFVESV